MPPSTPDTPVIYLEIRRFGQSLRVTAIDNITATEAVFTAPIHTPEAHLQQLARQKLAYILRQRRALEKPDDDHNSDGWLA